ncbi:AbrB family transcriptional regulator [Pseudaquabacterium rugosum]|uniref:AbrB family transcriptional regulator n=1 Tax=Pseudaquabacterium rugosum TaxID=2984194 RepID=A0ABU9BAH7_9BURK
MSVLLRSALAPPWRRALALIVLSLLVGAAMSWAGLPAALLLGPMVAAIVLAVAGLPVRLPRPAMPAAQGVVGLMMASHLPLALLGQVAADWPVFVAGTLATLLLSGLLGWGLARSGLLPGPTAIWGSAPGAATAMTLLSEAYGADVRLVAFMQYLRVLCCAVAASLVAHHFHLQRAEPAPPPAWNDAAAGLELGLSLAVALGAVRLGQGLRLPGGALLAPLLAGLGLQLLLDWHPRLPEPLLALAFACIGWSIGGRFTPEVLRHAARAAPLVLAAIVTLILANAGVAWLLVGLAGLQPLTALLATSPGGADSTAIVAASSAAGQVDVPFVMAMQVARFLVVALTGPLLAGWLSRRLGSGRDAGPGPGQPPV